MKEVRRVQSQSDEVKRIDTREASYPETFFYYGRPLLKVGDREHVSGKNKEEKHGHATELLEPVGPAWSRESGNNIFDSVMQDNAEGCEEAQGRQWIDLPHCLHAGNLIRFFFWNNVEDILIRRDY